MKQYPSIPHVTGFHGRSCAAFYKYDGSNLRFEWSRKSGWYKQGTRTRLFDHTDEVFGSAVELFHETYASDLEKVFLSDKLIRSSKAVMVFCEFFGPSSFSGQHLEQDPKELVLFDVNIHKRGFMSPNDFMDTFGHLKIAELIYKGPLTKEFEQQVREGIIPGLNEGVVCKGGEGHDRWMCKIKTNAYREKLQTVYADGWKQFWE